MTGMTTFFDQVFIDPTFFSIFICGPVQSFVVNVLYFMYSGAVDLS